MARSVDEGQSCTQLYRKLYDGEISYVDDRIGCVPGRSEARRGLYDDAVIVFVSDHGEQLWERGKYGHGERDAPRRGGTSAA